MKWLKHGLIFCANGQFAWMKSHAQIPLTDQIDEDVLRIYFSTRDEHGRSLPAYLHVDSTEPKKILYVHDQPILSLGNLGTFDESGIMPFSIVRDGDKKY